jgi:hypothetical protein
LKYNPNPQSPNSNFQPQSFTTSLHVHLPTNPALRTSSTTSQQTVQHP